MHTEYKKKYSYVLKRDIEFKRYGLKGKPCLVFPPQDGSYIDYENFGMVDVLADYINEGKIQLFCIGSLDKETWSDKNGNPRHRIELQEKWFKHLTEEMIPYIQGITARKDLLVTGCSMGGMHSGIVFFRRPDLFDTLISLSGVFESEMFFGQYFDDLIYNNTTIQFLNNMPLDHEYLDLYRQKNIIVCIGQGAWEGELIPSNRTLEKILKEKNIPAWFDYWGFDVSHDWEWWQKQIKYFMDIVLNK